MKRNLDKWAADGETKLLHHRAFDLRASEVFAEMDAVFEKGGCSLADIAFYALERGYYTGIVAGYKMKESEIRAAKKAKDAASERRKAHGKADQKES